MKAMNAMTVTKVMELTKVTKVTKVMKVTKVLKVLNLTKVMKDLDIQMVAVEVTHAQLLSACETIAWDQRNALEGWIFDLLGDLVLDNFHFCNILNHDRLLSGRRLWGIKQLLGSIGQVLPSIIRQICNIAGKFFRARFRACG
mmetsp:Transcript_21270/g.40627  ORF Transcript_21270/g.40627 Transcript_21270/m.40627 type:complete len:143 (-) Transcript_21270:489-917(-)